MAETHAMTFYFCMLVTQGLFLATVKKNSTHIHTHTTLREQEQKQKKNEVEINMEFAMH